MANSVFFGPAGDSIKRFTVNPRQPESSIKTMINRGSRSAAKAAAAAAAVPKRMPPRRPPRKKQKQMRDGRRGSGEGQGRL